MNWPGDVLRHTMSWIIVREEPRTNAGLSRITELNPALVRSWPRTSNGVVPANARTHSRRRSLGQRPRTAHPKRQGTAYGSLRSQGRPKRIQLSNSPPSLRANGSRECALGTVIASGAKQSILLSSRRELDCFASLAMTLLWFWIRLHPRDAMRPRRCFYLPPEEGVGNAGCPLHPRSRVHLVAVERTRVTTSTPESPGIPARNGFNGFLRALPGDRACLPPSLSGYVLSKPGWADLNSANLTPASGRQDHTTSPYAATSLVRVLLIAHKSFDLPCNLIARKTLPRPPHPAPRP